MSSSSRERLTFINADLGSGKLETLHVRGAWIAARDDGSPRGTAAHCGIVVDLQGERVLPGLINAHDHLQLNNLPIRSYAGRYRNAREWIADMETLRRDDPAFEARVRTPRETRLLLGAVKNLLSGATTVAHHDPLYRFCTSPQCPVETVASYGWSHSLYLDGAERVLDAYRRTPAEWPWIIHAGEGVDEEAAGEFERLEGLGCIGANTLLVHGVAFGEGERTRLRRAGAGLIWCPTSNLRLFGSTAETAALAHSGRVALGTDSRLTGARDLLAELRTAREVAGLDDRILESLVTESAARLLRLADRGVLRAGARADLVVLPAGMRTWEASRADLRLVMRNGIARYGDEDRVQRIAPAGWTAIEVDGRPKLLETRLARLLLAAGECGPGVRIEGPRRSGYGPRTSRRAAAPP